MPFSAEQREWLSSFDWIISQTRIASDAVSVGYQSTQTTSTHTAVPQQICTLVDAAVLLISRLEPADEQPFRRLGQTARRAFIEETLREVALFKDLLPSSDRAELCAQRAEQILDLFDALRIRQIEDAYIYSVVDESGEVVLAKEEAKRLLDLLVYYQEYQATKRLFDAAGLLERATQLVLQAQKAQIVAQLPRTLLMLEVEQLKPLEASLLSALSLHCSVSLAPHAQLLAEDNAPKDATATTEGFTASTRYLRAASELLSSHLARLPQYPAPQSTSIGASHPRHALLASVLDRKEIDASRHTGDEAVADISLWQCQSPRQEVERVFECISSGVKDQRLLLKDVQCICFDVERYRPYFEDCAQRYGLAIHLRKNVSLRSVPLAQAFQQFLRWVDTPGVKETLELFEHPILRSESSVDSSLVEAFVTRHQARFERLCALPLFSTFFAEQEVAETIARQQPSAGVLQRFLRQSFLLDGEQGLFSSASTEGQERFMEVVLNRFFQLSDALERGERFREDAAKVEAEQLLQAVVSFLYYQGQVQRLETLLAQAPSSAALYQWFTELRLRLSECGIKQADERRRLAKSARALQHLLRQAKQTLADVLSYSSLQSASSWPTVLRLLTSLLDEALLAQEVTEESIWVSEFLDARSVTRPHCIVLGCSEQAVRSWSALEPLHSKIDELRLALASRTERQELQQWLWRKLLSDTDTLVLSYFEADASTSFSPSLVAQGISRFAQQAGSAVGSAALPFTLAEPMNKPQGAISLEGLGQATKVLQARQAAHFGEFDAYLPASLVAKALKSEVRSSDCTISPGALECYIEDPFLFYLRFLLSLAPETQDPLEEMHMHLGIIVHKALERFFSRKGVSQLLVEDFSKAASQLGGIAKEVFEQQALDWQAHPILRSRKELCMLGLAQVAAQSDDDQQRLYGPLRLALEVQRRVLQTTPLAQEYRFGGRSSRPGVLRMIDGSTVEIRGSIDRIDGASSSQGVPERIDGVWDYKTGKAPSAKKVKEGIKVQLPLYVQACREHFALMPQQAGVLQLSTKQYSAEDFSSPSKGPVQVLLKGDETTLDEILNKVDDQLRRLLAGECMLREAAEDSQLGILCRAEMSHIRRKWHTFEHDLQGEAQETQCDAAAVSPPKVKSADTQYSFFTAAELPQARQPSAEQEAACCLDQAICLSAGAGSGKTFVLQTRVLRLIAQGVPLTSILALTFTQKAAAEMHERIVQGIERMLLEPGYDAQARAHFERAAHSIGQLQVRTINSFCKSLLHLDPSLSGVVGSWRELEQAEMVALAEELFEEILLMPALQDSIAILLRHGISASLLQSSVISLIKDSAQRNMLASLTIDERVQQQHIEFLDRFQQQRFQAHLHEFVATLTHWCSELEEFLHTSLPKSWKGEKQQAHEHLLQAAKEFLAHPAQQDSIDTIDALAEVVNTYRGMRTTTSKNIPRNFLKEIRELLPDFRKRYPDPDFEPREHKNTTLLQAYQQVVGQLWQRYQARKQQLQVCDFDDQIQGAHRMLCGTVAKELRGQQQGVRTTLQQQYRYLLVDEFQDTNLEQWEILKAILGIDQRLPLTQRQENAKGIFLVGDLQQSIYSFRAGDSRVFRLAQRELVALGGQTLSLVDNYRSHPDIIAFINAFFSQLFSLDAQAPGLAETATKLQPMKVTAQPAVAAEAKHARVRLLLSSASGAESEEGESSTAYLGEEVSAIVSQIKAIFDEWQEHGTSSAYPDLDFSASTPQIAILCRRHKQLERFALGLELEGLGYRMQRANSFYEREEITHLVLLLRLLADPSDAVALVGVLRSPLGAVSDAELLQLSMEFERDWSRFWTAPFEAKEKLAAFRTSIAGWRAAATAHSPSALLERIFRDSGLAAAYQECGKTEALHTAWQFIELLRQAEQNQRVQCSLHAAVRWAETQRNVDAEVLGPEESHAPIVLSTIHAAKGLEFPMVVIPGLATKGSRSKLYYIAEFDDELLQAGVGLGSTFPGRPRIAALETRYDTKTEQYSRVPLSYEYAQQRQEIEDFSEARRLFYVACTRAERYLWLSYKTAKTMQKKRSDWQKLSIEQRQQKAYQANREDYWLELLHDYSAEEHSSTRFCYRGAEGQYALQVEYV